MWGVTMLHYYVTLLQSKPFPQQAPAFQEGGVRSVFFLSSHSHGSPVGDKGL